MENLKGYYNIIFGDTGGSDTFGHYCILYNFILFIVYSFTASLFIINKHLFYYFYKKIQILSISKTIILKIPQ